MLAQAAADRLGAYSRKRGPASRRQRDEIHRLFLRAGPYLALQITGDASAPAGHSVSLYCDDLFTNWFEGTAWDWCFAAAWPERRLLWVGFLSDVD